MNLSDLKRSLPRARDLATNRTLLSSTATSTLRPSICPAFSAAVTAFSNLHYRSSILTLLNIFSNWFTVNYRVCELTFQVPSHIGLEQSRDKLQKASRKTLSANQSWRTVPAWAHLLSMTRHRQFGKASKRPPLYT